VTFNFATCQGQRSHITENMSMVEMQKLCCPLSVTLLVW
jgi:hypothetical protein